MKIHTLALSTLALVMLVSSNARAGQDLSGVSDSLLGSYQAELREPGSRWVQKELHGSMNLPSLHFTGPRGWRAVYGGRTLKGTYLASSNNFTLYLDAESQASLKEVVQTLVLSAYPFQSVSLRSFVVTSVTGEVCHCSGGAGLVPAWLAIETEFTVNVNRTPLSGRFEAVFE